MIRLYGKNYDITYFEDKFVFKAVLCPRLKCHDYNDYTTLLSDLSHIDFDMVCLLTWIGLYIKGVPKMAVSKQ